MRDYLLERILVQRAKLLELREQYLRHVYSWLRLEAITDLVRVLIVQQDVEGMQQVAIKPLCVQQ